MVQVAVMGAGSWGTTVAKVCADAGSDVTLWARRDDIAREINGGKDGNGVRINGARLPRARLADGDVIELGRTRLKFESTPA